MDFWETDRHGDDSAVCQRMALPLCFTTTFFLNLAWILYGLLFVIHPVYPEQAKFRYSEEGAQR